MTLRCCHSGLDPESSLKRPGFPPTWERRLDSRFRGNDGCGNDGSRINVKLLLRHITRFSPHQEICIFHANRARLKEGVNLFIINKLNLWHKILMKKSIHFFGLNPKTCIPAFAPLFFLNCGPNWDTHNLI